MHDGHQLSHFRLQRFDGFLVDFNPIRLLGRLDLQTESMSYAPIRTEAQRPFPRENEISREIKLERTLELTRD